MYSPSDLRGLVLVSIILCIFTSYAQVVQGHSGGEIGVRVPPVSASINGSALHDELPILSDRFAGLALRYRELSTYDFSVEQIAVAFVSAMAHQAREDFEEPQPQFVFTDMDQSNPVRIRMQSLPSAGTAVAVRANIMWALKMLPITLFHSPSIRGMQFFEQYRGRDVYSGILDNRNTPLATLEASNQTSTVNVSQLAAEGKRALDYQMLNATKKGPIATTSNTTTTFLAIPGSSNKEYQVVFQLTGSQLPKVDIFSTLLEFLLALGPRNSVDQIGAINLSGAEYPVWIYILRNDLGQITEILQIFQVIAIADAIARHYVQQRIYQEMIVDFNIDGQLVAGGCMTKADRSREWCAGIRGSGEAVVSKGLQMGEFGVA